MAERSVSAQRDRLDELIERAPGQSHVKALAEVVRTRPISAAQSLVSELLASDDPLSIRIGKLGHFLYFTCRLLSRPTLRKSCDFTRTDRSKDHFLEHSSCLGALRVRVDKCMEDGNRDGRLPGHLTASCRGCSNSRNSTEGDRCTAVVNQAGSTHQARQ